MNYFRITVYHKQENISAILDSNGLFEKLWQFSAFLVEKGFDIIEVSKEDKFEDGDLPSLKPDTKHILLRAAQKGEPTIHNNVIKVDNKTYSTIKNIKPGI